jgi:hypothetical protein
LFEKIERLTSSCRDCGESKIAKRRFCQDCKRIEAVSRIHRCSKCKSTNVDESVGCVARGSNNVKPGIKLRPKDLRDYFASTVQTTDPRVLMSLMRHTNLTTTTKYLQAHHVAMKEAVSGLGKTSSKTSEKFLEQNQNTLRGQKSAQNDSIRFLAELLKSGLTRKKLSGFLVAVDRLELSTPRI